MLNEPSILANGKRSKAPPIPTQLSKEQTSYEPLQAIVAGVMDIHQINYEVTGPAVVSYTGQLRMDSEAAYEQMDIQFKPLDYLPLLTTNEQGQHTVVVLKGRVHARPRPWWPNAVLLVLTLASLLFVGAVHEAGMRNDINSIRLLEGWPYALSMILILGTHELGHYFAARHHGVNVTLPYFIPAPTNFGTLGAFIQLREPMRNRKILFDVGVAGPLAGLIVTIPILLIGLATSKVEPLPTGEAYTLEGNSVIYASAKYITFGEWLPTSKEDVFINQLAKAGWTGLFLTGLNLVPLGQLDGGHIIFTLLGKRVQRLYMPIVAGFLMLTIVNQVWLLWTLLLFFFGRLYAVPLDTITPLNPGRRWLGYLAILIFILVFVPNPLQGVQP